MPQVPRMQEIVVGYGSKLSATLGSDFHRKIPRAWKPRRTARGLKSNLCRPFRSVATRRHTWVKQFLLIWIYRFMGDGIPIVAADPHPGPPIWTPGLSYFSAFF